MLTDPQYINQNHIHILKEDSTQDTAHSSVYKLCTQLCVHVMHTVLCTCFMHNSMCACFVHYSVYTCYVQCSEHRSMCTNYVHSSMYMFCTKVHQCTFCTQFHVLQVFASAVKLRAKQSRVFKERRLGTPCRATLAPYAAVGERNNCDIRVETKLRWLRDIRPVHQRRIPCHDQQWLVDTSCN